MTVSFENLTLRGPRHLISSLHQLEIDISENDTYFLWLNTQHQITAQSKTPQPPLDSNLIVLRVNNDDAWQDDAPNLTKNIADETHVLDVLVVHRNRWRSLLCTDNSCCPTDGIEISPATEHTHKPRRAAMFAQWQTWLLTHQIPEHLRQRALQSLRDLPLRDALLAQLAHEPETINRWLQLQDNVGDLDNPAWLSILSSVYFLEEKVDRSHRLALHARELNPDYSLARLLIQAFEADAPRGIVLSAFSRYTSRELLDRAQFDLAIEGMHENATDEKYK